MSFTFTPNGFVSQSGSAVGGGTRVWNYSGVPGEVWGPTNIDASMNQYNMDPTFASISSDGLTATWTSVTQNVQGDFGYSGPVYVKFTATIASGGSHWDTGASLGLPGGAYAVFNSTAFTVDMAMTASLDGVNFSPFNSVGGFLFLNPNQTEPNLVSGVSGSLYTHSNDAPTGGVTITGNATDGQVLTADTSSLADGDELGTLHYQWIRNGITNVGADQSTYTLGDADVGATINVVVSYTDGFNTPESVNSSPTTSVSNGNDGATLVGMAAAQTDTDKTSVSPFAGVTVSGTATNSPTQVVTVTLDDAAKGSFTALNGFTNSGGGVYTFTGTLAAAATALDGLVFTPAPNRVTPGSTETTTFTITSYDGSVTQTDSTTTVVTTSVDDAPTITGTAGGQTITDQQTVAPFSGVTIADVDSPAQTESVSVTLDHPDQGAFTAASLTATGFVANGSVSGEYDFTGTAAAATTAIQGLVFQPIVDNTPNPTLTTTFTVAVSDGTLSGSDAQTTVVANEFYTVIGDGVGRTVFSGQTSNGLEILSGGSLTVRSGGKVTTTVVSNGGESDVSGSGSFTSIYSGGTENVQSGGVTNRTVVNGGGVQVVFAGGSAVGDILSGGSALILGKAISTTIDNGGIVRDFGIASGTVISAGGVEYVESGGIASGTVVSGGGIQVVSAGGTESRTVINGGGADYMQGNAVSTTVNSGGTNYNFGIANGVTVNNGGLDFVEAGGTASGTVISGGGVDLIENGGLASGATVSNGGIRAIFAGGIVSKTTLFGTDYLLGTAVSTTVNNGAIDYDYGVASGNIINSGGLQFVEAGASASGTVISGGIQVVSAGGTESRTTLNGGADYMLGTAVSTTVNSGGTNYNFGITSGVAVNNGGIDFVEAGGTTSGAVISGGLQLVEAGGLVSGATISSGGLRAILAGATASKTVLNGGTDFNVGVAVSTTVNSGGTNFDYGVESGGVVNNGGLEFIKAGATASGSVINNGGIQIIENTGLVSGATVSGGGEQVVLAGGTLSGTTVIGGIEYVEAGGVANGSIISGGLVEITSGGSANLTTFATSGGGTLRLDDSVHFTGLVAGFGLPDNLDLADIGFVSGVTTSNWTQLTSGANASGTLTVSGGGHVANITLLGQYVVGNFHIQDDGHGGTLVTDPPVVTAAVGQDPLVSVVGSTQHG